MYTLLQMFESVQFEPIFVPLSEVSGVPADLHPGGRASLLGRRMLQDLPLRRRRSLLGRDLDDLDLKGL